MTKFDLKADYKPKWDQPKAIKEIVDWFVKEQASKITLLGATWTWKTFTMANIIQKLGRPTLVISHNKTLAAQLATEFKYFFPNNAVHYFVSYFDYYQPEAYLPHKDMYIEKDSSINQEIEMYRLATLSSLLSREDVIVVSSVSALYGLGSKQVFEQSSIFFEVGKKYDFGQIKKKLLDIQYQPAYSKIEPWTFDFRWEVLDIYSSVENVIYRLIFDENVLERIQLKDLLTWKDIGFVSHIRIWPATQFLQDMEGLDQILVEILQEMSDRVQELKSQGKELEAQRIQKRTEYDVKMIKETWYVNGIENYSRYFDRRQVWEPPSTLFDYFPKDMLIIIDESHMSVPQLRAMPQGDKSRKISLVEHGFRLPSALDHRPLLFEELSYILNWESKFGKLHSSLKQKKKQWAKSLFVSATPGEYEIKISNKIVEQLIRPTGLLDPFTYVYPKSWDYELLFKNLEKLLQKKPELEGFLKGYDQKIDLKKLFLE